MSRSIRLYLRDIIQSCSKISRYTQDLTIEAFVADERTYDAVLLNLQIVGEAVKQIPQEFRDYYPETEWRKISGLRDILAHAYFQINIEIVWDVVQNKLTPLQAQIREILEAEFDDHL
ncbi:HepT-like ribonuclease domain-containing protein [Phormidesmis priestleyi]